MTLEQVDALLSLKLSAWWRAYLSVAFMCGLRPGEMHGLQWQDVDTEAGTLSVRHSLKKVDGRLVPADLKTASSKRTIRMPAAVVDALKAHRSDQLKKRMRAGAHWQDHGLVFSSRNGTPRKPLATAHRFKVLCELAGIGNDWTLYETRHTFVSVLSYGGATTEAIADAADHSNSHVTQVVYRHSLADTVTTAATIWDTLNEQTEKAAKS